MKRIILWIAAAALLSCGHINDPSTGPSWRSVSNGLPENTTVKALAADAAGAVWYAGTVDGVFKSTTRGADWQAANTGLEARDISALAVHPKNAAIVFAGTWGKGVFRSVNAGGEWQPVWQSGMNPLINDIVIAGDGSIWIAAEHGLYVSGDNGANWRHSFTYGKIYTVAVHPQRTSRVYIGARWNGNFRSDDAGATWQPINKGVYSTGQETAGAQAICFLSSGAGHMLMSTDYTNLYKSLDGGDVWERSTPFFSESVLKLVGSAKSKNMWALTKSGELFFSENEGQSWERRQDGIDAKVKTVYLTPGSEVALAGTVGKGIFQFSE